MTYSATLHETLSFSGRTSKTIMQADSPNQLAEMIMREVDRRIPAWGRPAHLLVDYRRSEVHGLPSQFKVIFH